MSASRVLGSIGVAWAAWLAGHALIIWKGLDYVQARLMYLNWSGEALLGLLVLVIAALLLAAATFSLVLSWVGLFTVGIAQTLTALLFGFPWALEVMSYPTFLLRSVYSYHAPLGVHLALGGITLGMAVAGVVRSRTGPASVGLRFASLMGVPMAVLGTILLLIGGVRTLRTFQIMGDVDVTAVSFLLGAFILLGGAAASGSMSGVGPAVAGLVLLLPAIVGMADPQLLSSSSGELVMGWTTLSVSGGLLLIAAVLTAGGLALSLAGRTRSQQHQEL